MASQNINIAYTVNTQQIQDATAVLQKNISSLTTQLAEASGGINAFYQNFSNLSNVIVNGWRILTKSFDLFSKAFEGAIEFENISTRMAPVMGGLEKTRALLKDIRMQSANGAASFDELAKTAQILSGAFKSQETIKTWVEAFHNLSATTGKSANELAAKFAEVRATGKGTVEMLKQYAQGGVNIFSIIAKQRGITENEVAAGLKARTISLAEVEQAILHVATGTGELAQQAGNLSNTFAGTIDTIAAKIKIDFADKIEPMLQPVAGLFNLCYDKFKFLAALVAGFGVYFLNPIPAIKMLTAQVVSFGAISRGVFAAFKATLISTGIGAAIWAAGEAIAFCYEKLMNWYNADELAAKTTQEHKDKLTELAAAFKTCGSAAEAAAMRTEKLAALQNELEAVKNNADLKRSEREKAFREYSEKVKAVEAGCARQIKALDQEAAEEAKKSAEQRAASAKEKISAMEQEMSAAEKTAAVRRRQIINELGYEEKSIAAKIKSLSQKTQLSEDEEKLLQKLISANKELARCNAEVSAKREDVNARLETMKAEIESEEKLIALKKERSREALKAQLIAAGYTDSELTNKLLEFERTEEELENVRKQRAAEKELQAIWKENSKQNKLAEAAETGGREAFDALERRMRLEAEIENLVEKGVERARAELAIKTKYNNELRQQQALQESLTTTQQTEKNFDIIPFLTSQQRKELKAFEKFTILPGETNTQPNTITAGNPGAANIDKTSGTLQERAVAIAEASRKLLETICGNVEKISTAPRTTILA